MERLETNANLHTEETLDPQDWRETLALSHRMVDGQSAIFGMFGIDPYGTTSPKTFGRFLPRRRRVRPSR
jgi:hypothetical protein